MPNETATMTSDAPPMIGCLVGLSRPLLRYVMSRAGGDEELALDIAQETLSEAIAATTAGKAWPHEEALWAWLVAVTRNKLVDEFRRRRLRPPSLGALGIDLRRLERSLESGTPLPDDLAGESEVSALCRAALSELPPAWQSLLEGAYCDGVSHRELARERGTTAKAVESMLARARKAVHAVLRRLLAKPEELL